MDLLVTKDTAASGGQIDVWAVDDRPDYHEDSGEWFHAKRDPVFDSLDPLELSEELMRRSGGKKGWPAPISISFGQHKSRFYSVEVCHMETGSLHRSTTNKLSG